MKKQVLSVCLALVVVIASFVPSYAKENNNSANIIEAEAIARDVEDVTGTKNIIDDYSYSDNGFECNNEELLIEIPEDGDESIIIDSGENSINFGLPKEAQGCEGVLTDDGTIVYYDDSRDSSINVQMVSSGNRLCSTDYVRVLETIENENASHEYEFEVDMPDGYKLVRDYDYDDGSELYDCGEIYIVDEQGNIADIITKAWAVDAEGKPVETHYIIDGNKVRQVIEFDSYSAFPIVADPGIVQTKTVTKAYTKNEIKTLRDQYTGSVPGVCSYLASMGVTIAKIPQPYCKIVGCVCSTVFFAGALYYTKKYNTWNEIWGNMGKNDKCNVTILYKWNNNLETYYMAKITKTDIK